MKTREEYDIVTNYPVPPGAVLEEELEARKMTQRELAQRAGRPVQVINEIIRGKKAVTHETALDLEKVLGIPAQFWVNLESLYQMTLAKNREREQLQKQVDCLKDFPVSEMERRGWIPSHVDEVDKVRDVLAFLGIASFRDCRLEPAVQFRLTGAENRISEGALIVWLRKGELDGREIQTKPYREALFMQALSKIRALTREEPDSFIPKMMRVCSDAGVAVVLTPEFPKSAANGAARWLSSDKALIQLSLRWKWADVFWFSLFHEAAHVLRHQTKTVYVDGTDAVDQTVEAEANAFARDILLNPMDWARFVDGADWSPYSVIEFANRVGISPSIVVGRMHHEGIIPYSSLAHLKARFKWVERSGSGKA
ncbi:MAG: HigA family addiction module antitoxin [Chloroflexota bacterium]|nr:HigA family addiction module antitoxin [Chloroflexota bacterium]